MMRYAGIIKNDIAAAPGVCLSFFTQGCPFHCKNCHNPETWDFDGGKEFTYETLQEIENGLFANGIPRTFCIMGGEPLCESNSFLVELIIKELKKKYPDLKIWIWTGYTFEQLLARKNSRILDILSNITGIVDGPYIDELRDISLPMRGSSNQRIIDLTLQKNYDKIKKIKKELLNER